MSTEITDEEIEEVLLKVLKKQIIDDQVEKEKRIEEIKANLDKIKKLEISFSYQD